jgi:hypothetical protein
MKKIKFLSSAIVIISSVLTLATMLHYGRPWKYGLHNMLSFAIFGLWAISPYLSLGAIVKNTSTIITGSVIFAGLLIISLIGNFIYYDIFFLHHDAQTGSAFLYVPFLQWIICFLCFAVLSLTHKKDSHHSPPTVNGG